MTSIYYKKGFKYQLAEEYSCEISLQPGKDIESGFIQFKNSKKLGGTLVIKKGYAWDGPSGPAIDTKNFMRGSLVHDALYQLMRERHLDSQICRDPADKILRRMCVEDGMWKIRAWWVYKTVKLFARSASSTSHRKPLYTAP